MEILQTILKIQGPVTFVMSMLFFLVIILNAKRIFKIDQVGRTGAIIVVVLTLLFMAGWYYIVTYNCTFDFLVFNSAKDCSFNKMITSVMLYTFNMIFLPLIYYSWVKDGQCRNYFNLIKLV